MNPNKASELIRAACLRRPELRFKTWPRVPECAESIELASFQGFCYIATMAFCAKVNKAKPWCDPGRTHFWAEIDGEIWDLTKEQFDYHYPYAQGVKTKYSNTRRVKELLKEIS